MNSFILSYNPFSGNPTEGQLLNHVQVNRYISQYYQPFIGTYVVKSEQSATQLTDSMKGLFENSPFMLTQLFPTTVGGTLPQDVWNWISHGYIPRPPPPPPPVNKLSDLLGLGNKQN
ncbi:MAG: hypothetical protein ABI395_02155 [Sphingobium sp.]